jgi:hypothetical protein
MFQTLLAGNRHGHLSRRRRIDVSMVAVMVLVMMMW